MAHARRSAQDPPFSFTSSSRSSSSEKLYYSSGVSIVFGPSATPMYILGRYFPALGVLPIPAWVLHRGTDRHCRRMPLLWLRAAMALETWKTMSSRYLLPPRMATRATVGYCSQGS